MLKLIRNYINDNYGSRRGLLNLAKCNALWHSNAYRHLQAIDWKRVQRVIFICQGNICRSPLAEIAGRRHFPAVESFGLSCNSGAPADPRAIRFAAEMGLDLTAHRSRNIAELNMTQQDLLVGMEPHHLVGLKAAGVSTPGQITLAGLWLRSPSPYIHDPYSANEKFFWRCEAKVVSAVGGLFETLRMASR